MLRCNMLARLLASLLHLQGGVGPLGVVPAPAAVPLDVPAHEIFSVQRPQEPSGRKVDSMSTTPKATHGGGTPSHVKWLSMFNPDFDAAAQHSFANLGMSGNLNDLLDAHGKYGMAGFLSVQHVGVWATMVNHNRYSNQSGLEPDWASKLATALKLAEHGLRTKAIAGIFLGDERSCGGIPFSNVTAVADAVRAFLDKVAPDAKVYINECAGPFAYLTKSNGTVAGLEFVDCANGPEQGDKCWGPKIPASIDLISLDMYCPVTCSKMAACQSDGKYDPAAEVNWVRPFYEKVLVPRLQPHQQLFVVPGTFGDWNRTRSPPVDQQQLDIVRKLDAYWNWAQREPLIVGMNCWHWLTISGLYKTSPGIIPFYFGADHMPKVVARLVEIGAAIRNSSSVDLRGS